MIPLLLSACAPRTPPTPASPASVGDLAPGTPGVANPILGRVVGRHWEATMVRYPTWASTLGDHRYDDRWTDPSDRALQAWLAELRETELALASLPDDLLSRRDRTTRDLLLEEVRAELASRPCRFEEWSLSSRQNDLVELRSMVEEADLGTDEARAAVLARYRSWPAIADAHVEQLRRGLAAGRVSNAASVARVVALYDAALAQPVRESVEYTTVVEGTGERPLPEASLAAFEEAIETAIRPAVRRQRDFFRDEVLPAARTGGAVGLHALPDGDACYAAQIRRYTTLPLDAATLHQRGKDEIARIHEEFRVLGARALGTDVLADIFRRLREDPALRFRDAGEIRGVAEQALRRAEGAVPDWFDTVPTTPCAIDVVPDYLAPYTWVAWYEPGLADGSRPGRYVVNTFAPETRPRHEAEVLAFHESVPGHHLQIATSREAGELPAFRRYAQVDAFVEGWALYVERLADEMGLYSSDLDRLGMLSFDAWRAGRLVVDTGVHAEGWSREQAEAWFLENTPLMPNNIENEVDRYVTWPGQALAYKTGQMELRSLRSKAEDRLGAAFRVPAFHQAVLAQGAVTLPVLEDQIERWIEDTEAALPPPSEVPE